MMNKNFVLIIILVIGFVFWNQYNHENKEIINLEAEFQKNSKKEKEEFEIQRREAEETTKSILLNHERAYQLTKVWKLENDLPSLSELIKSYPEDD